MRQLFPMFSVAYIKQVTDKGKHKNKWKRQSLKVICVGTDPQSDGLLFYHPGTKTVLSCADQYRFDTYLPAGPQFKETFDGRFQFHTKSNLQNIHVAPTHETDSIAYYRVANDKFEKASILSTPFDETTEPYTIQIHKTGAIIQATSQELQTTEPTSLSQFNDSEINPLIPWATNNARVTILLPAFNSKPKQGRLSFDAKTAQWNFIPGRTKTHTPIPLYNFHQKALSMYHNQKLSKGWITSSQVLIARQARITSNVIAHMIKARKVSAKELTTMNTPTSLLNHAKLLPNDKAIWDASYREEYEG